MTTEEAQAPKQLRARWKFLIIFAAAVLAAIILDELEGRSGRAPSIYIASILGAATASFAIASIVAAFIRGSSGAFVGVGIVALFSYFAGSAVYTNQKPQREVLATVERISKSINETTKSQLDKQGFTNIDPAVGRQALEEMSSKAKSLYPQSAAAMQAIVSVTDAMLNESEELRGISAEISSDQFQNPENIKSIADIDSRLQRVDDLERASRKLIDFYGQLDLRVKTELARKGLPPLKAKEWADNFVSGAHLEIAIPLAQLRVQNAEVMKRQYNLLRSHFGRWRAHNQNVYFDDGRALQEWNANSREFFRIAEQSEALERKRVAIRQREQ